LIKYKKYSHHAVKVAVGQSQMVTLASFDGHLKLVVYFLIF